MPRTTEEITFQIEGLKKEKKRLPQYSGFGDDNWGRIEAQISVLEDKKVPDNFWQDEGDEDYNDGDNDIYFAAQKAYDWRNGSEDGNLFDEEGEEDDLPE